MNCVRSTNPPPSAYATVALQNRPRLNLLRRKQTLAARGSTGQGSRAALLNKRALAKSITPAKPNTKPLCSLNHTSCGTAETSPTNTAPAPNDTITAGNTQQSSVAELASSAAA